MKGSLAVLVLAGAMLLPSAASADVWEPVSGTPPASLGGGTTAHIKPDAFRAYTLDDDPVAAAPAARSLRASTVLTLPAPDGSMQRFEVTEAPIMEPGLAARHPEITTYAGRGIDDPAATIRADQTPLGFHASVRSPRAPGTSTPTTTSTTASTSPTTGATSATTRTAASSSRSSTRTSTRWRSRPCPRVPRSCGGPTGSRC